MRSGQKKIVLNHVLKYSLDIICAIDEELLFVEVSDACKQILGYTEEELEGHSFVDFIPHEDRALTLKNFQSIREGNPCKQFENSAIRKHGQKVYLLWSVVWLKEENYFFCVAKDITAQKQAEIDMRRKEAVQQVLIDHRSELQALLDENGNYLYVAVAQSYEKAFGYNTDRIMGVNALSLIHPDDLPRVQQAFAHLYQTQELIRIPDIRFKASNGEWRWVETTVSNQLANPYVQAVAVSSKDITEKKQAEIRLQESEQRFKSLFENNPDLIFHEDINGLVADVNNVFLEITQTSKSEIINKPLSSILPSQAVNICNKYQEQALLGSRVRFDLELDSSFGKTLIFDTQKIPVILNGKVIGVYTIAKDITPVVASYKTIEAQSRKLSTIFESITDAFFTLDKDWCFTYINSEFERLLLINRQESIGRSIWDVFPEEQQGIYYQHYHRAIKTGDSVQFEAYLQRLDMWLEVKAYPSTEGLSVYFNDITQQTKAKQELEKLSLVASRTNNSVIIADKDWRIEWVNDGFTRLTGYSPEEAHGKRPSEFLHNHRTDRTAYELLEQKLYQGESISLEVINENKRGEEVWVNVEISPVFDDSGVLTRFVEVQTDVTALKNSELALSTLTQDLYKQNRDLQHFTYIVSHNLRAPVANILGLSVLLSQIEKGANIFDKTLSNLEVSAHRLDSVLRDLNTILSIRDSKGNLEREPVKVKLKVQQALISMQERLESCGGVVRVDIDEELYLWANKAYLYSIFYNLLSNAIKYRSHERTLQVQIKSEYDTKEGVTISFADNGSGFDMKKAKDKVFKLYSRFHPEIGGKGIGLYLVKAHLEAMNGHIEVTSKPGAGTKFLIYLPKAQHEDIHH